MFLHSQLRERLYSLFPLNGACILLILQYCPRISDPTDYAQSVTKRYKNLFGTMQDLVITNLTIKFCLCYSNCKTKQQQPLCSLFPPTPGHVPIPHCPNGLSAANKTIRINLMRYFNERNNLEVRGGGGVALVFS